MISSRERIFYTCTLLMLYHASTSSECYHSSFLHIYAVAIIAFISHLRIFESLPMSPWRCLNVLYVTSRPYLHPCTRQSYHPYSCFDVAVHPPHKLPHVSQPTLHILKTCTQSSQSRYVVDLKSMFIFKFALLRVESPDTLVPRCGSQASCAPVKPQHSIESLVPVRRSQSGQLSNYTFAFSRFIFFLPLSRQFHLYCAVDVDKPVNVALGF